MWPLLYRLAFLAGMMALLLGAGLLLVWRVRRQRVSRMHWTYIGGISLLVAAATVWGFTGILLALFGRGA